MSNELDAIRRHLAELAAKVEDLTATARRNTAADERLLRQALVALTYHEVMTRPIESTTKTVAALRQRLGVKG